VSPRSVWVCQTRAGRNTSGKEDGLARKRAMPVRRTKRTEDSRISRLRAWQKKSWEASGKKHKRMTEQSARIL